MNKKASIHIGILVLLVLFTSILTLYSFIINSDETNINIFEHRSLDKLFSQKNNLEFQLSQSIERAFLQTFNDFAENRFYIDSSSRMVGVFSSLNENLENNFLNEFNKNLEKDFSLLNLTEVEIGLLKDKISNKNYKSNLDLSKEKLSADVENFELSLEKSIVAKYLFDLNCNLDFNKIGIDFFDEIFGAVQNCKSKENFEECIESELDFFDAIVKKTSNEKVFLIELVSKNYFIFEDELQKIEIDFYVSL